MDLAWGVVLTRYLSMTSGQVGQDFLSVGRVQSPTLAIIVDREKQIDAFKPKPYWVVASELAKGETVPPVKTSDPLHESDIPPRIVDLIQSKFAYKANATVIKTADELTRSLLDILA